jgi:hypothetical protein
MGQVKKAAKRAGAVGGALAGGLGDALEFDPTFGAKGQAERAQRRQAESIVRQKQQEDLRLAEADSEVERRRMMKRAGGRRSLIASK